MTAAVLASVDASDALNRASGDQDRGRWSGTACQRRNAEHHEAGPERPSRPVPIAEHTGAQEKDREHQRIGVDDPLQTVHADAEAHAHARQRDIHDRRVQLDDDEPEARREHDPADRRDCRGRASTLGAGGGRT
jgi:hypothetical protein